MTSVFDRRRSSSRDRRGWASHSVNRSWQTIDHPENARTGPSAWERRSTTSGASAVGHGHVWCVGGGAPPSTKLVVVDVIPEHDIEPDEKLPGQGDAGLRPAAAMQDGEVAAPQVVVGAGGQRSGLAEHPAQKRVALLGDFSEVLFVGRGATGRGQADVTHDMLGIGEPRERAKDKHRGERGQGTDARMGKQQARARIVGHHVGDLVVELIDPTGDPRQQLQAIVASAPGVRGEVEGAELGQPTLAPQFGADGQALIEGDRLQPVLHHGAHPDETNTMRHERAQIPRVGIRHPHRGKAAMLEEVEQVPSIAPIGLRFPDDHGADLGRLTDKDGVTKPVHEAMEPLGIAGGLDADGDGWPECAVEMLDGVAVMGEFMLENFTRGGVENRDLLFSRVQTTSDDVS